MENLSSKWNKAEFLRIATKTDAPFGFRLLGFQL